MTINASRDSRSGVPLTCYADRVLVGVIANLVAVRPVNWEDSRDPEQRRAWQAADRALVKYGPNNVR